MVQILMPYAESPRAESGRMATRLASLDSMTVGIVNNSWRCMNVLSDHLTRAFREDFGVVSIIEKRISAAQTLPPDQMADLADTCDAVVVGIGN